MAFTSPVRPPVAPRSVVAMRSTGEYTGFVPDMQRRTLMNLVVVAAAGVPATIILGGYLLYFVPVAKSGAGGAQVCGDEQSNPVKLADWVKKHTLSPLLMASKTLRSVPCARILVALCRGSG